MIGLVPQRPPSRCARRVPAGARDPPRRAGSRTGWRAAPPGVGRAVPRASATGRRSKAALPGEAIRPSPVRYASQPTASTSPIRSRAVGRSTSSPSPATSTTSTSGGTRHDRLVRTLTSTGRLVVFDKRGMGLSDRPDAIDVDGWTLDALAVLDAAGVERAVLFGVSAGVRDRAPARGPASGARRRRRPVRRVRAHLPRRRLRRRAPTEVIDAYVRHVESRWGTGVALSSAAPSLAHDPAVRAYWARDQWLSASPAAAMRFLRATSEADVRSSLPTSTSRPSSCTRQRDALVPVGQGRYVAEHIAGAES